ncbi:MAG: glycosyltransferase family 4 protein [Thermodesulfobacteriota bacterium]
MKICLITHAYPIFKGDWRANFIESLARSYAGLGHSVTVLVSYAAGWQRTCHDVPGISVVTYRYAPFERLHTVGYGKSLNNDLHMNPWHGILAFLLVLCGILRFADLLRKEKYDLVQAHWALPNTLIALGGRLLAATPATVFTSFPGSDVTIITKLGRLGKFLASLIGKSDYLSCNSRDLKEDLVKAGIRPERIDLVIYGVDDRVIHFDMEGRLAVREKLGIADEDILLLMVGRFVPKKGFSTAFRALKYITARHPSVKLAVIGKGVLMEEYLGILRRDGTQAHAYFLGEVEPRELSRYYSACDIFLMPSERFPSDGLNVVVPEAMACGRPVVASDAGGNDLVVSHGVNGYLHAAGDPADLAERVISLINDPAQRDKMGNRSVELVASRFNWLSIAKHYIDSYRELSSAK